MGELRLKILNLLTIHQLKSVVRVCRRWKDMGEDPYLWQKLHLTISARFLPNLNEMLQTTRLKQLKRIHFGCPITANQADEVLKSLLAHGGIVDLDIPSSKLTKVNSNTISCIVKRMERIVMTHCRLSVSLLEVVFQTISKSENCRLKMLDIGSNDLHKVSPSLVAGCVSKLSSLKCDNTYLQEHQVTDIFKAIGKENSKVTELSLTSVDLSSSCSTLMARTLSKLKFLNLWATELTLAQVETIFTIIEQGCKIERLNLSSNDLSGVASSLFANSVSQLEVADVCHCELSLMQVTMLLTKVATSNCRLTKLDLRGNLVNQQLPDQLIKQARMKLNHLELTFF